MAGMHDRFLPKQRRFQHPLSRRARQGWPRTVKTLLRRAARALVQAILIPSVDERFYDKLVAIASFHQV